MYLGLQRKYYERQMDVDRIMTIKELKLSQLYVEKSRDRWMFPFVSACVVTSPVFSGVNYNLGFPCMMYCIMGEFSCNSECCPTRHYCVACGSSSHSVYSYECKVCLKLKKEMNELGFQDFNFNELYDVVDILAKE